MLLGPLPDICRDAYRLHWDFMSPRIFLSPLPFFSEPWMRRNDTKALFEMGGDVGRRLE